VTNMNLALPLTIACAITAAASVISSLAPSMLGWGLGILLITQALLLVAAWIKQWETAMGQTEQTFVDCLAAAPDRSAGIAAAINALGPGAGVTLIPSVMATVYERLDAMPARALASWAASQWPNYLEAWAAQTATAPKTFEEFLGARVLVKDNPDAPVTGVESYRFNYPGGFVIDVMPSGIYSTTVGGQQKMGDNLEALEIELFKQWERAA
jgi:hypothetical protein